MSTVNENHDGERDVEEDECRVCRGPAEVGYPLFKPCLCSGSIGLIHQDCLQSWLEVQRGDGRCELCHFHFRFEPQYDANAPASLPLHQICTGLLRRAVAKWLPFVLRSVFAASLWLVVAPLLTAYLYHGWMARPSVIIERSSSSKTLVTDLISGGVVAACIILSFLSLMSFADFLRVEWQQRGGFGADPGDVRNRRPAAFDAAPGRLGPAVRGGQVEEDMVIDNTVWDHVQQHVIQQPSNRRQQRLQQNEPHDFRFGSGADEHHLDSKDEPLDEDFDFENISDQEKETINGDVEVSTNDQRFHDKSDEYSDDDDESWHADSDLEIDVVDEDDNDYAESDDDDSDDGEDRLNGPAHPIAPVAVDFPRENNDDEPQRREQQQNRVNDARAELPFDMDPDEPLEMDINIALDELLGVRGPFHVVGRNLLWLLAFNAVYLCFFACVPRCIGMAMGSVFFNTTANTWVPTSNEINATDLDNVTSDVFQFNASEGLSLSNIWKTIDAESMKHNTTFRLHDIASVAFGYLSLAFAVICMRSLWFLSQKVRFLRSTRGRIAIHGEGNDVRDPFDEINRVVQGIAVGHDGGNVDADQHGIALGVAVGIALDAMIAIVKVSILLFLKMFVLPVVLGIALDVSTISILGSTLEARIAFAGQDIFSYILFHWVAGITFMLLVTVSVLQLREVAHPDLLAHMIRPQEPQPDLLGNLMHESVGTHSKRMFLSLIIYAFLLTVHVFIPVRLSMGGLLGGDKSNALLELRFCFIVWPQLQIPLELLFFHICMLALLEKYKNGLGGMQFYWLRFMSNLMGLSERILPHKVKSFCLVGSRPVFQGTQKVDRFWYSIANGRPDALTTLQSNITSFTGAEPNVFDDGDVKPNGARVVMHEADFIRLPVRLPGNALRSRSILVPTKLGKFRLSHSSLMVIDLWEEVPGDPITRPPEGWDDLGVGGANVQGRWAWGLEKKSTIEDGVAARRPFFEKGQPVLNSTVIAIKLLALGILSWIATSSILCNVAFLPLAVGRFMYFVLRIPYQWRHDPLAYGLGFMILFSLVGKVTNIVLSIDAPMHAGLRLWLSRFRAPPIKKTMILCHTFVAWFIFSPLLLGMSYDVAFIRRDEWFAGQTPLLERIRHEWINWMCGFILLHVWSLLCCRGVLTKNFSIQMFEGRDVVENDENDGVEDLHDSSGWQGKFGRMSRFWDTWIAIVSGWEWDKVDESVLSRDCATPVVSALAKVVTFPLLVWGACIYFFPGQSGAHRAMIVRSLMALIACIQVCRAWRTQLHNFAKAAHKTARDDRYLIGEILMNHGG